MRDLWKIAQSLQKYYWLWPAVAALLASAATSCILHAPPVDDKRSVPDGKPDKNGWARSEERTHRKITTVSGRLPVAADGKNIPLTANTRVSIKGISAVGTVESGLLRALEVMKRTVKELSQ